MPVGDNQPVGDELPGGDFNPIGRWIAALFLRASGWQGEGQRPAARRYVLIAAPHTSNWDLPYLLAFAQIYGVRISWMGKHQLFRGPVGWLFRKLGGVPVRRDRKNDLVSQMAELVSESDGMALVVPAEGTRAYTSHWKSGFYHIARTAVVPIVPSYLDFSRRRGGFGPEIIPTGDVREDMDVIRAFYKDKVGKHPALMSEIVLKEEG
jgi:1-acyl-sn-glycerol-3-phosphate acyltransferase